MSTPILVVDDHPANLVAFEALLHSQAVEVVTTSSGQLAVERLTEREYALVLLDFHMPGLDGIETARRIRELYPDRCPPIIIITAQVPDAEDLRRAYDHGVVDFVQKPVASDILRKKVGVFVDLFEQRERLRRYEQAERENFERQLIAVVSHDLRTPLSAVLGTAELGVRTTEADEASRRLFKRILRAGRRAERLVNDLLDYTRVLHGNAFPIQREPCCMANIVRHAIDELRATYPSSVFHVEATPPVIGEWDCHRLAQVVINLASNAVHHGGGSPITIAVSGTDSRAELRVHNQGEPIPPELLPNLFEPLMRGSNPPRQGSLGLGLFIVQQIVTAHGGTIELTSSREQGTTARIQLLRLPNAPEVL